MPPSQTPPKSAFIHSFFTGASCSFPGCTFCRAPLPSPRNFVQIAQFEVSVAAGARAARGSFASAPVDSGRRRPMDRLLYVLLKAFVRKGTFKLTTSNGNTYVLGDGTGSPVAV